MSSFDKQAFVASLLLINAWILCLLAELGFTVSFTSYHCIGVEEYWLFITVTGASVCFPLKLKEHLDPEIPSNTWIMEKAINRGFENVASLRVFFPTSTSQSLIANSVLLVLRVLLRVRMLYYLRQEVIGDQAERILEGADSRSVDFLSAIF